MVLTSSRPASGQSNLLERTDALAALEHHLAAVCRSSQGRVVFIGGEAGVGKTSLVRHFCAHQSIRAWSGACDALAAPHALGPLLDIAEAAGGELRAAVARGARAYEVAAELLTALRADGPSIVVLEDLHWADGATLDVVRLLGRRIETAPVLLLATYRDDQVDRNHPLRVLIGELATGPPIFRLSIGPLSPGAVSQLAEPIGLDADELYRNTGGNPFFVTEVLAAGGDSLPQTVQDAVLARVARLGPRARRVVDAVAIVPNEVDVALLEALSPDAADGLEECLASGVLATSPGGVSFRHELARLAVEVSLPPTRRVALHRAAVVALSQPAVGAPDPTRLAHHAEAAGDTDAVLRFAVEAALLAARAGSHREAAAQYERALRFAAHVGAKRRADLLSQLSAEAYMFGDYPVAVDARRRAIDLFRELGDRVSEGDAWRAMSANLRCQGRVEDGWKAGAAAVELLEPEIPGVELARAYANRAMLALNVEDMAETRLWGARALALAERTGDSRTLVHAMNTLGTAGYLLGEDDGRQMLERSLQLCKDDNLDENAGRAYIHLAWASARRHDHQRGQSYQREGVEYCLERGLDAWRYEVLGHQARRQLEQGDWEGATESTSTILRTVHTNAVARSLALSVVAVLRARRGDPDHRGPLDEARAIAAPTHELQHLHPFALAAAEITWLEGGPGRADAVDEATRETLELAVRQGAAPVIAEVAAWRRRCGVVEPVPPGGSGPDILELAGDAQGAAEAWLAIGCDYQAAVALCSAGDEEDLRRALSIFQALDARPAVTLVARMLREQGARGVPRGPRPSTLANAGGLTAREIEVLGLVAHELQNRDIAARLHLSTKTVDHHVASIMAKLGVATRGKAVSAAARLGIEVGNPAPR